MCFILKVKIINIIEIVHIFDRNNNIIRIQERNYGKTFVGVTGASTSVIILNKFILIDNL